MSQRNGALLVETREVAPFCVVMVTGEIDLATATDLEKALTQLVRPGVHLVVDLSAVTFMDCAGLNALIRTYNQLQVVQGDLRTVAAHVNVRLVIEATSLSRLLHLHSTLEAALSAG